MQVVVESKAKTIESISSDRRRRRGESGLFFKDTMQSVVQCFDQELEDHQGRMSKQMVDMKHMLIDRVKDLQVARDREVRELHAMEREVAKDQVRIVEEEKWHAIEAERERLRESADTMINEAHELRKIIELRDFQLARATVSRSEVVYIYGPSMRFP